MRRSTLCYLSRGNEYLMLHRVKKKNDCNEGKWIGVGGGFEPGETADTCLLREVREETGLTLTSYTKRGIVDFISDQWEDEEMHLYTADAWTGTLTDCDEGVLEWIDRSRIPELPTWEGDRVFLDLIAADSPFFRLRLEYRGDKLIASKVTVNGKEVSV